MESPDREPGTAGPDEADAVARTAGPGASDAVARAAARVVLTARGLADLPPGLWRAVLELEHALFLDGWTEAPPPPPSADTPGARHLRSIR